MIPIARANQGTYRLEHSVGKVRNDRMPDLSKIDTSSLEMSEEQRKAIEAALKELEDLINQLLSQDTGGSSNGPLFPGDVNYSEAYTENFTLTGTIGGWSFGRKTYEYKMPEDGFISMYMLVDRGIAKETGNYHDTSYYINVKNPDGSYSARLMRSDFNINNMFTYEQVGDYYHNIYQLYLPKDYTIELFVWSPYVLTAGDYGVADKDTLQANPRVALTRFSLKDASNIVFPDFSNKYGDLNGSLSVNGGYKDWKFQLIKTEEIDNSKVCTYQTKVKENCWGNFYMLNTVGDSSFELYADDVLIQTNRNNTGYGTNQHCIFQSYLKEGTDLKMKVWRRGTTYTGLFLDCTNTFDWHSGDDYLSPNLDFRAWALMNYRSNDKIFPNFKQAYDLVLEPTEEKNNTIIYSATIPENSLVTSYLINNSGISLFSVTIYDKNSNTGKQLQHNYAGKEYTGRNGHIVFQIPMSAGQHIEIAIEGSNGRANRFDNCMLDNPSDMSQLVLKSYPLRA